MNQNDENVNSPKKSLIGCTSAELVEAIKEALDSKKGEDIKIIKIDRKAAIADYFVLCSGSSNTHVQALARELEFLLGQVDIKPAHVEGKDNNSWILIDYSNVIVHIFSYEARDFYNIERLYTENGHIIEENTTTEE